MLRIPSPVALEVALERVILSTLFGISCIKMELIYDFVVAKIGMPRKIAAVTPSPGPTSSSCSIRVLLSLDLCDLATIT